MQQQGIASLALVGELRETMDVLSRFGCQGEPRVGGLRTQPFWNIMVDLDWQAQLSCSIQVLLLSSQRHSSGINLQARENIKIIMEGVGHTRFGSLTFSEYFRTGSEAFVKFGFITCGSR